MNYLKFVNQARQQQLQNYRALIEKNNQLAKSIYQKQQAIDQNKALIIEADRHIKTFTDRKAATACKTTVSDQK